MCICYPLPCVRVECYPLPCVRVECYPLPGVRVECYPLPGVRVECYPLPGVRVECYPLPGVKSRMLPFAMCWVGYIATVGSSIVNLLAISHVQAVSRAWRYLWKFSCQSLSYVSCTDCQ